MRSLRVRLVLAMLVVVLLAVGTATAVYLREVTGRLEQDLVAKAAGAAGLVEVDVTRLQQRLERELDRVLDPRGPAAELAADGTAARRWLWASGRLEPGQLDILEVLTPEGLILTSGHWPASLGAVDPDVQRSGAGKAMVEAILDHARSLPGINAVALTTGLTWESAHGLYQKTGFQRAPERDWVVPDTDIKLLVYRQQL